MNPQPIETARDADLRLSVQAMQRAARRALELAHMTDTAIVVLSAGVLQTIHPSDVAPRQATSVHEPSSLYGGKP
jgi:hypothetical protein